MSFTDPSAPPVPGDGANPAEPTPGAAPYQQYLEQIPEEHRGLVEPAFRQWDGDVTRRFQEASEYRRTWEPYEQAGLHQYDPAEVSQVVRWAESLNDPDALRGWVQEQAQALGLLEAQSAEPGADDDVYGSDPAFQAALRQALGPIQDELRASKEQLAAIGDWRDGQELQTYQQQAQSEIDDTLDGLAREHGDRFDRELVEQFLPQHIREGVGIKDAIAAAFRQQQDVVAKFEQSFFDRKAGQPAPPVVPGVANGAAEEITGRRQASAAALAMLKERNRA